MLHLGPIKRRDLIYYLSDWGLKGHIKAAIISIWSEKRMVQLLTIPNPHQGDIGEAFLLRILKQAGIDRATWEKL